MARRTIPILLVVGAGLGVGTPGAAAGMEPAAVQTTLSSEIATATSVTDWSDQRRKKSRRTPPPTQGARVACTELGCHPVPPGCYPVPGINWRGDLTGFDRIVCQRR